MFKTREMFNPESYFLVHKKEIIGGPCRPSDRELDTCVGREMFDSIGVDTILSICVDTDRKKLEGLERWARARDWRALHT